MQKELFGLSISIKMQDRKKSQMLSIIQSRRTIRNNIVQNMAGEIFVHACHILKWAETCLVASQNIYLRSSPTQKTCFR